MLEERTLQGGAFSSEISGMTLETRAGNLRKAESMPVRSIDNDGYYWVRTKCAVD